MPPEKDPELQQLRLQLLEQEHRTLTILGRLIRPPKEWTPEEKQANKTAFWWTLARMFVPGSGAGSGGGLLALVSLVLLAFQTITLRTQTESLATQTSLFQSQTKTLEEQTLYVREEGERRKRELESLRPILSLIPRIHDSALRLGNTGTAPARVESITFSGPGFSSHPVDLAGFAPFSLLKQKAPDGCTLRVEQRLRADTFLYPIRHEGSREKEFLKVGLEGCEKDWPNETQPHDYYDQLRNLKVEVCYCEEDRDRCWSLSGNWYRPPTAQMSTTSTDHCD